MAAATKRVLDIEDAVIWACAEELAKWPHVNRGPDLPQLGELVGREDGLLIGKWRRPANFLEISPMFARGFVPRAPAGRGGDPHPDALVVEAEISAIAEGLLGSPRRRSSSSESTWPSTSPAPGPQRSPMSAT